MGLFTRDIKSMQDLFLHGLQDVYYAEKQIVNSLPTMIEKSKSNELSSALKTHLRETENQVSRLEQVFEKLGQQPKGTDCPAMDGLIREANEIAGEVDDQKVLDAAVISSAQAIEHYEISRYGTLIAWAQELGHDNVVSLLNANLKEEKATDKKLSGLAEGKVNPRATGRRVAAQRSASPTRRGSTAKKSGTAKRGSAASRSGGAKRGTSTKRGSTAKRASTAKRSTTKRTSSTRRSPARSSRGGTSRSRRSSR